MDKERYQSGIPKLLGIKIVGKIEIKHPEEQIEIRSKVGYQFDKYWKDKLYTRVEMQKWAVEFFQLKIEAKDFLIDKLSVEQVKVLGLKLKFGFDIKIKKNGKSK